MELSKKVQGHASECGKGLWGSSGSDGGGIFAKECIAGAMESVFDHPMATIKGEQLRRVGLRFTQTADEADLLGSGFSGAFIGADTGDAAPLPESGPLHMPDSGHFDAPGFVAPMAGISFLIHSRRAFFPAP